MSSSGDTERIDFALAVKNTERELERFGEAYGRLKTLFELTKEGLISIPEASARVNMTATQFVIEMGKAERDIHFYEQTEILLNLLSDAETDRWDYVPENIMERIIQKIEQSSEEGKLSALLREKEGLKKRLKYLDEAIEESEHRIIKG